MKITRRRILINLTVFVIILGGSWLVWRAQWSRQMLVEALESEDQHYAIICMIFGGHQDVLVGPHSNTPLVSAASLGWTDIVGWLLEGGSDPDEKHSLTEASALHCAAGHYPTVEVLLEHGADVQAKDHWGYTPLQRVALSQKFGEAGWGHRADLSARLLLRAGADPREAHPRTGSALDCWPALAEILKEVEGEKAEGKEK